LQHEGLGCFSGSGGVHSVLIIASLLEAPLPLCFIGGIAAVYRAWLFSSYALSLELSWLIPGVHSTKSHDTIVPCARSLWTLRLYQPFPTAFPEFGRQPKPLAAASRSGSPNPAAHAARYPAPGMTDASAVLRPAACRSHCQPPGRWKMPFEFPILRRVRARDGGWRIRDDCRHDE